MKFRKSIRWRIQAWHSLLMLALCVGFGVTAYRLENSSAFEHEDQGLEIRLGMLGTTLQQGGGGPPGDERGARGSRPNPPPRRPNERDEPRTERPPPPEEDDFWEEEPPRRPSPPPRRDQGPAGFRSSQIQQWFKTDDADPFYFVVWHRDGGVLARSENAPADVSLPVLDAQRGMKNTGRVREGNRELYHFTPPGECILVGKSSAKVERHMREFAMKVAGIGGGLMALGLVVGWWISSRALRPIADISAAATRIAEGHLHERIQTSETDSELGQLAALLDSTFQRLDAAFEEQARFTSDAAHELRTPVSVILAQSQLALSRERSPESYRETIEMSQRAARRMHGLIESLLQLAVLDAPQERELPCCDLAGLCREHLSLLRPLAEEKAITIFEDLSPAECRANADQIAQILINLVGNAVKFCPTGAVIHVATRTTADAVVLSVRDSGPGIAAEHLPFLFERFYRTDKLRSRATGGSGLGLAICQRIAEAHDGKLTVQSVVGAGTEFCLRLPIR